MQNPGDRSILSATIDAKAAAHKNYDVVIIGSGVSGSILAKEISAKRDVSILVVEAGLGKDLSELGYQKILEHFYSAAVKDNNAPYVKNPNADMPRGPEIKPLRPGEPNTNAGYWVQYGPYVSDSSYARVLGGTTQHWEAKTPRMLSEDFSLKKEYGQGLNWPIGLDQLQAGYQRAEFELGVSGDAAGQRELGVEFASADYVYPMKEMAPSYLDEVVRKRLTGMSVTLDNQNYKLDLHTFPQARNGEPNEKYRPFNGGNVYTPKPAVSLHQTEQGERCQGNTNCVPICPVQAKYDARKTLADALLTDRVDRLSQAVASRVYFDGEGRVTKIDLKVYASPSSPEYKTHTIEGKLFLLTANAVENARLLLASAVQSGQSGLFNDLLGRNLMDHPFLLAWGLLPEDAGVGRGPLVTSGICNLRRGSFRSQHAAMAIDIHNDGSGWAGAGAENVALDVVMKQNKFGAQLRQELLRRISRQLQLACMIEMMPEPANRVTVDPGFTDALGNMRPVVSYRIPDYTLAGMEYASNLCQRIFQRLGVEDMTNYSPFDPGYVTYNGKGYALRGGNHLSGTHIMGKEASTSVVDSYQRAWGHPNLFIIGAGSMPTIGTSNTTLTVAALCYRTVDHILQTDLKTT